MDKLSKPGKLDNLGKPDILDKPGKLRHGR